jgi:hypothetical protein
VRRLARGYVWLALAVALAAASGCGDDGGSAGGSAGSATSTQAQAVGGGSTSPSQEPSGPGSGGGNRKGGGAGNEGGGGAGNEGGGGAANQGGGGARPRPGTGTGAANSLIAAGAVLTAGGTPAQACGRYVTKAFLETAYGSEENCLAARRKRALAQSIVVGPGTDEKGTHIVVVPKGGPYDGHKVEVDLVEEGGAFRVDALEAHVPAGP